jgi:hypothetical protein
LMGKNTAGTSSINGPEHIIKIIKWFVSSELHLVIVTAFIVLTYFILKNIHLRYGSPNLAFKKFNRFSKKVFDYILENERSADIFVIIWWITFGICALWFVINLLN